MYRIAKLAELLNVSTVRIHEKLILCKDELSGHTRKENGVIAVSEQGLLILKHAFENEKRESEQLTFPAAESDGLPVAGEERPISAAERRELELLGLKDRLNSSRNELHRLNLESRRLDEAITHYMGLLKEDFEGRIREEDRLEGLMRIGGGGDLPTSQIGFFGSHDRK